MAGGDVLHGWQIVCFSLISLLGLTGNSIVCFVMFMSSPNLRSVPFNAYITSLAATDLLLSVIGIPIYVISKSAFRHPEGVAGDILCKFITGNLIPFWLAGTSVYFLVLLSFERYYAIKEPFLARTRTTSRKTKMAIIGAFLCGLLVQVPVIAGVEFTSNNATISNYCTYAWKNKTAIFFIYFVTLACQYVIPAILFVINFARIRKCLTNLDGVLRRQSLRKDRNRGVVEKKRRTIKTIFILVVAFFVCWTPNTVMFFLFQYAGVSSIKANSDTFEVSVVLAFSSAWVNPVLYSFQSQEFRSHCKTSFEKIRRTLASYHLW